MNGWTPTIPTETKIANLIEQIPQEYRNRAVAECMPEDGNSHDYARFLVGYVMRREWEFYPHPANEAEFVDDWCDPRTTEEIAMDNDWKDERDTRESVRPF